LPNLRVFNAPSIPVGSFVAGREGVVPVRKEGVITKILGKRRLFVEI
jgi:hypothetical protein